MTEVFAATTNPLQNVTFGAMFANLKPALSEGMKAAHKLHFGTTSYFVERDLAVHRAFDRFCLGMGLNADETAAMRKTLVNQATMHSQFMTSNILILRESLPDAFKIRGGDLANNATLMLLTAGMTLLSLIFWMLHEVMSRSPALQRSAWADRPSGTSQQTNSMSNSMSNSDPQS